MTFSALKIVATSIKRFYDDKCFGTSIVISYFALLCAVPVVALFAYITTQVLGDTELAFRSLNIFTEEFFASLDPSFFEKVQGLSKSSTDLGLFGLIGSLVSASFLFSNLISSINNIFRAKYHRSFFYNRLMEYLIMFVIGIFMLFSLSITAVWTALQRIVQQSVFVSTYINPEVMSLINNFFVQYLIPYALTFLVFFTLYKFIPEVKVHSGVAALSAAIGALLWEGFKRVFVIYVTNFSAVGIVLSKLLAGTLTSIIFFLLWISFSLSILLWGAELAAVLNERKLSHAP